MSVEMFLETNGMSAFALRWHLNCIRSRVTDAGRHALEMHREMRSFRETGSRSAWVKQVSEFIKRGSFVMKRITATVLMFSLLSMFTIGCAEKSTHEVKKTTTTPQGTTTETEKQTIKQSGNNPPNQNAPAQPPAKTPAEKKP